MKELDKNELLSVDGGININGTLITSLTKGINVLLDLGRSLGTAIRRIGSKSLCSI